MNVDIFGKEVPPETNSLIEELTAHDTETLESRLERLKFVYTVYPRGDGMMSPETFYLFDEARRTFINGEFVSTILLTQACIEHWLEGRLRERGYKFKKKSQQGLKNITSLLLKDNLLHPFLVGKIDALRKIRNPLVHLRPITDPEVLSHRSRRLRLSMDELLEKDARSALSLMYQIVQMNV